MKAKITQQINGYLFEWSAPYNLVARVSRLRTPSDGQVRGELEIHHRNGERDDTLLVPTQVNFSSEPTRARYAKGLSEKLAVNIEWKEVFDYLSKEVIKLARAGDEPVEVSLDSEATPPTQLVPGLIYKDVSNIMFGEKGVKKSTLAYLLGICLALPWQENPLDLVVPKEAIKVLVLDWETDLGIFRYYVTSLRKGMGIPICSLHYRRCALSLADDIETVQRYIEETGAELLIIDSLGAAAGGERGDLKGSEAALLFNAALRKLKRTSLIIAQTAKGDADSSKKTIFGSTYFTYYARNIFELCSGQDEYGDTQHLGLIHRQCNLGRRIAPMGFQIEFGDNDTITIEREPFAVSEFIEKVSSTTKILESLKQGSMTSKELVEYTGLPRNTVDQGINRLRRHNRIIDTGDKKWGLPTNVT